MHYCYHRSCDSARPQPHGEEHVFKPDFPFYESVVKTVIKATFDLSGVRCKRKRPLSNNRNTSRPRTLNISSTTRATESEHAIVKPDDIHHRTEAPDDLPARYPYPQSERTSPSEFSSTPPPWFYFPKSTSSTSSSPSLSSTSIPRSSPSSSSSLKRSSSPLFPTALILLPLLFQPPSNVECSTL